MAVIEIGRVQEVGLYINRGAVLDFAFEIGVQSDADDPDSWVATDVTGWAARLQVRDSAGNLVLALSTAAATILNGGTNGRFTCLGTPTQTRAVPVGEYVWAAEVDPDGDATQTYRPVEGPAYATDEVVL